MKDRISKGQKKLPLRDARNGKVEEKRKFLKRGRNNNSARQRKHTGGSVKASEFAAEEKKAKQSEIDQFLDADYEDDVDDSEDAEDLDTDDDAFDDVEMSAEEGGDIEDMNENLLHQQDVEANAEETEGTDPVSKDNKRLRGEISTHRAQLEALKARDPEFYAYLQQTDSGLLDFGGDDSDIDEDEDEEPSEQKRAAQEDTVEEPASSTGRILVTSAVITKWSETAMSQASLGTMKYLIKAYRMACHYGDSEEEEATSMQISSAAVYNQLMLFMLKEADGIFRRMLGIDKKSPNTVTAEELSKLAKWRKVGPLVKSFWGNSCHLLGAITDPPLLAFALRRLRASILLIGPFRKLADKFLKSCLDVFGGSVEVAPRVQAFLAIRSLALTVPQPYMERCLKGVYRCFLSNSKFVSAASAPHIAFMSTCCVELWGLDLQASYAHAFGAIRQLALSLRGALNMTTEEAYKEIYSWQGINCLEMWGKVLGAHSDKEELRPLVYPLTQLLLGAARLVPTPRYFPLRLRLVRALNRLAQATGFMIPVAPILLEMLHWSDLRKHPKSSATTVVPDITLQLRAGKSVLKTPAFQEEIVTQVQELLCDHLTQWSCSIAFPEVAHLVQLQLRRFVKTSPVERFRRSTKQLVDVIDKNIQWVGLYRDKVDFSPKDILKVNEFLSQERASSKAPLQQYNIQLAAKAAQRQALRSTTEVKIKRRRGAKDVSSDEEDIEDEADAGKMMQLKRKHGELEEEDDDQDFEGNLLPKKKVHKDGTAVAKPIVHASAGVDLSSPEEDVVHDYMMSDEEEEKEISDEGGEEDADSEDITSEEEKEEDASEDEADLGDASEDEADVDVMEGETDDEEELDDDDLDDLPQEGSEDDVEDADEERHVAARMTSTRRQNYSNMMQEKPDLRASTGSGRGVASVRGSRGHGMINGRGGRGRGLVHDRGGRGSDVSPSGFNQYGGRGGRSNHRGGGSRGGRFSAGADRGRSPGRSGFIKGTAGNSSTGRDGRKSFGRSGTFGGRGGGHHQGQSYNSERSGRQFEGGPGGRGGGGRGGNSSPGGRGGGGRGDNSSPGGRGGGGRGGNSSRGGYGNVRGRGQRGRRGRGFRGGSRG